VPGISSLKGGEHDPGRGQFKRGLSAQSQCLSRVTGFEITPAGVDVRATDLIIMPDPKTAPDT